EEKSKEKEEFIEGLIHISELSPHKVSRPEEVVSVGDEVRMKVIKIDAEARKLGLSIRAFQEATGEDPFIFKAAEAAEAEREAAAEAQEAPHAEETEEVPEPFVPEPEVGAERVEVEEGPAPSEPEAEGGAESAEAEKRPESPEPPQVRGEGPEP
ncbi:MAG: S1 RNA-binding domain-containing protein, partial [Nitrospinota bacterium]